MQANGELHPNWRALSTVHIPYKVFISEGTFPEEPAQIRKRKYEVKNVSGTEAKEFYENTIQSSGSTVNFEISSTSNSRKAAVKKNEIKKIEFNKTQFFLAATENNVQMLQKFSYSDDNVNVTDEFGWTGLMMAACEGSENSFEYLLQLGARLNVSDKSGNTAFSLANRKGFTNILQKIINAKKMHESSSESEDAIEEAIPETFYCDTCKLQFTETIQKKHETSTLHQFNSKKFSRKYRKRFNISEKNRGLQLMLKQGWDRDSGLGPSNSGQLYPIKTVIRKQRTGLGIQQDPAKVTHFKPYDVSAVKYKPQPRDKTRKEVYRDIKRERRKEQMLRTALS